MCLGIPSPIDKCHFIRLIVKYQFLVNRSYEKLGLALQNGSYSNFWDILGLEIITGLSYLVNWYEKNVLESALIKGDILLAQVWYSIFVCVIWVPIFSSRDSFLELAANQLYFDFDIVALMKRYCSIYQNSIRWYRALIVYQL